MERFTGLIPPVVTPFLDGEVDTDSIAAMVGHAGGHLDGVVVAGSCGEGPSMSRQQRLDAFAAFHDAVAGRLPVIAGVAGTSPADIGELMGEAEGRGVVGFLVPPPFYFANSAEGLRDFYRTVARSTSLEVMVYDNPSTTKTVMSPDLVAAIVSDSPNINHVKVTDPDMSKVPALRDRTDATLLAGSDEVMHHQVLRGCEGAVTAAPQVFPTTSRAWFDAARSGDDDAGRRHYDQLAPFIVELLLGPDQYPAVVKLVLKDLGVIRSDEVLSPLTPLDSRRRDEITTLLRTNVFEAAV
jgi:4-hydroxy-tetrahydrodipicolinate synthase